jgi:hypothetical protein
MVTIIFGVISVSACVFLVYVLIHFLRETPRPSDGHEELPEAQLKDVNQARPSERDVRNRGALAAK